MRSRKRSGSNHRNHRSKPQPRRTVSSHGSCDEAVRESRDRIAAALQYSGFKFPVADITINMAPADLRKEGSSFDLPLAIGILGANSNIIEDHLKEYMMVGELSLDGTLQPIRGALPIAIRARAEHFKGLIVPEQNVREAAVVNNLEVYGMKNLLEVIQFMNDQSNPSPTIVDTRKEFYENQSHFDLDYADVRGQENVKRALEVAAAGGHNLIMVGPPGSGKSMMAKRLPSILPPLTLSESLETTQIHSIAGKLGKNVSLISQRPFRSPHHTISQVALVGGGATPQPGEISLHTMACSSATSCPSSTRRPSRCCASLWKTGTSTSAAPNTPSTILVLSCLWQA